MNDGLLQKPDHRLRKVLQRKDLARGAFILRFERKGMEFKPGQHLSAGIQGSLHMREYSIYSGTGEDFVEILVRRVEGGLVSNALGRLEAGDQVKIEGPFGFFTLPDAAAGRPLVLVASGTGIAPFHSLALSRPDLDIKVLHGIRTQEETFGMEDFGPGRVIPCVSGEHGAWYHGRVSAWLMEHPADPAAHFMLCGNCDMIYSVYDIISSAGVPQGNIQAEVYF